MGQLLLLLFCCCIAFMSGYGVRAMISMRRRREARAWEARNKLLQAREAHEPRKAHEAREAQLSSAIDSKASATHRTKRKPRVKA